MRRRRGRLGIPPWILYLGALLGASILWIYDRYYDQPPIIQSLEGTTIRACFTPYQKCQKLLIETIEKSTGSILVMAYYITAEPIINALIEAKERGVTVQIIVDPSQIKKPKHLALFLEKGVDVFYDDTVAIAHNKVMVLDHQTIVSGSYNFTHSAEKRNAENLLILYNPDLAKLYEDYWHKRKQVSTGLSQKALEAFHETMLH